MSTDASGEASYGGIAFDVPSHLLPISDTDGDTRPIGKFCDEHGENAGAVWIKGGKLWTGAVRTGYGSQIYGSITYMRADS